MSYPPITYITDCTDGNARARLTTRIAALMGTTPVVLPLRGADLEASASLALLDTLLATECIGEDPHPTTVLFNVAPRDGKWENGAPFCYFWYNEHLVAGTFSPRVLGTLSSHLGIDKVHITDISQVMHAAAARWANFSDDEVNKVITTQFRSLWYLPLLAKWVLDGHEIPYDLEAVAPQSQNDSACVAAIDNFGNCKTNVALESTDLKIGDTQKVCVYQGTTVSGTQEVPVLQKLVDVPYHTPALIVGSSGVNFLELVIRGGSAAKHFGLKEGYALFTE